MITSANEKINVAITNCYTIQLYEMGHWIMLVKNPKVD